MIYLVRLNKMNTNFKNSNIYKKALLEYQKEVYGKLLKPLHSIVIDDDEVYLFYEQDIVNDVFEQIKDIFIKDRNDEETNFTVNLWYEEPRLDNIIFMWLQYKVIALWYDNCEVPQAFKAKIKD